MREELKELIRGLPPELKRKVRAGLDVILDTPESGKPLQRELCGLRSLRVGRYRVVYRIVSDVEIELVVVGPRPTVYDETLRKIDSTPADDE